MERGVGVGYWCRTKREELVSVVHWGGGQGRVRQWVSKEDGGRFSKVAQNGWKGWY